MIARLDLRDAGPDLDDDAAAFVAEQVREKFVGPFHARNLAELRAADARALNLDAHLADVQRRHLEIGQHERRIQLDEHCRLHVPPYNVAIAARIAVPTASAVMP